MKYSFYKHSTRIKAGTILLVPFGETISMFEVKSVNKKETSIEVKVLSDRCWPTGHIKDIGIYIYKQY